MQTNLAEYSSPVCKCFASLAAWNNLKSIYSQTKVSFLDTHTIKDIEYIVHTLFFKLSSPVNAAKESLLISFQISKLRQIKLNKAGVY